MGNWGYTFIWILCKTVLTLEDMSEIKDAVVSFIASAFVLGWNCICEVIRHFSKSNVKIDYSKNVIVITGCDSGFGESAALQLSKLGFKVVACCLTTKGVDKLKDRVALALVCNVTSDKDIANAFQVTETYCNANGCKVWTVLNNAGVGNGGALDWINMDTYKFVFSVNFFGVVAVTKAFLPLLKRNPNSRIINLSSLAGLFAGPKMTAYCASKHAVEGFAKGLRAELRPWKIHVCNINPGFMRYWT